jgi:hypothetical protein
MGRIVRFVGALLFLAGIVLLAWAIYRGVKAEPSFVGSLATAASAILVVVVGREREKRAELQAKHREVMTPVYEEFIDRVINAEERREGVTEFYKDLQLKLLLRGPASVISALRVWNQEHDVATGGDLVAWEAVLHPIRSDLGFDDSNLDAGDLLRVYIRAEQIDELMAARKEGRLPDYEQLELSEPGSGATR